ncbi:hypothetical protein QQS21_005632 [Conoideocrella luteorostrata]|uniref:Inosine/uridine-preferring nucleoside hydrolase domain-containing protein n=1 Tax=Conoideocrella luteorostrata TaxID=1105319 RepID=A0AAJ0CP09_9HYPO|nr:hypothetical protein QQS21_005632 [Conoideocrella luteorostrata]
MHWSHFILAFASLGASATIKNGTHKVVMDNDWGTVEFAPYLMALKNGWDVLGLVSNTANTWSLQCGLHGLATLELGGLHRCIPVHKGADWPLLNTPQLLNNWEAAYGKLPFQGAFKTEVNSGKIIDNDPVGKDPSGENPLQINREAFLEGYPNATFASEDGAMFMIDQVRKNAKELVVMGGYIDLNMQSVSGNHILSDICSDVNLKIDPEAAKIALTADFPQITIVGNAANTVFPDKTFNDKLKATLTPYSNILEKYLVQELPIWDAVAAAVMINPAVVINSTDVYLDVNVARNSQTYGNVYVFKEDYRPTAQKLQKVRVITHVDVENVRDMIVQASTNPKDCDDVAKVRGG